MKSRVTIQLSGCDWHYFYNEGIHGEQKPAKSVKAANTSFMDKLWSLCPYYEIQVLYGRIIMGNSSLPYSLTASLSDGQFYYRKPNKHFRQIFDGQAREFEVYNRI